MPSGVSSTTASIDLSWTGSVDAVSTELTYEVYRDDPANLIGTVTSSGSPVSFTDTGLWPGTTHTYWVRALDEAGNPSAKVSSDPISVLTATFADDFSGGLAGWTSVTRITSDVGIGSTAPPSARGNPTGQSAFATTDLPSTLTTACLSAQIWVASQGGTTIDLFRLRTSTGGPIAKTFIDAQGRLLVRNDFAGTQVNSLVVMPAGWNRVELCGTVGAAGWDLYLNGNPIVSAWQTTTGSDPVGRIQIGDTAAKTWTVNWDDVIVDGAAG